MTEHPPVVAMGELVTMLGVTRKRVSTLVNGVDFPKPVALLSVGRLWSYEDVVAWAGRTGRTVRPLSSD